MGKEPQEIVVMVMLHQTNLTRLLVMVIIQYFIKALHHIFHQFLHKKENQTQIVCLKFYIQE